MIFLSGVMLFAIPWIENKRNKEHIKEHGFPDIERYVNPEEGIIEVDEDDEEEEDPDHKPFTMKTWSSDWFNKDAVQINNLMDIEILFDKH